VRPRDAVEVTAAFGTAYLPGEGGSVTATYCKQHAPIEGA
jgi:hypothetical protein